MSVLLLMVDNDAGEYSTTVATRICSRDWAAPPRQDSNLHRHHEVSVICATGAASQSVLVVTPSSSRSLSWERKPTFFAKLTGAMSMANFSISSQSGFALSVNPVHSRTTNGTGKSGYVAVQTTIISDSRYPLRMCALLQVRHNEADPTGVPPFTFPLPMGKPF
ncbi:MAG TPA: hypothetical protein VMD25_11740 [Acidobacteriaceae bacterium]|nr:hypothetical protein [Acidobacteriaceae bacterium]